MTANLFTKGPNSKLDYKIDWSAWLGTDTISVSTWTNPTGITKDSDTKTATTTTIWLSGGTLDVEYLIINKITTVGGRIDERSFSVLIKQK